MTISNSQVADLLRRFAGALALEGADRFKIKAYRRAADSIESLTEEVADLVANGADLKQIPGVGKALSRTIEEIVNEGKMVQLDKSLSKLSPELVELATRPSLDPKIVTRIYKKLNIANLKALRKALESGRIGEVFGSRTEFHVRRGLDERPRMLLYDAAPMAQKQCAIYVRFQALPTCPRWEVSGVRSTRLGTLTSLSPESRPHRSSKTLPNTAR